MAVLILVVAAVVCGIAAWGLRRRVEAGQRRRIEGGRKLAALLWNTGVSLGAFIVEVPSAKAPQLDSALRFAEREGLQLAMKSLDHPQTRVIVHRAGPLVGTVGEAHDWLRRTAQGFQEARHGDHGSARPSDRALLAVLYAAQRPPPDHADINELSAFVSRGQWAGVALIPCGERWRQIATSQGADYETREAMLVWMFGVMAVAALLGAAAIGGAAAMGLNGEPEKEDAADGGASKSLQNAGCPTSTAAVCRTAAPLQPSCPPCPTVTGTTATDAKDPDKADLDAGLDAASPLMDAATDEPVMDAATDAPGDAADAGDKSTETQGAKSKAPRTEKADGGARQSGSGSKNTKGKRQSGGRQATPLHNADDVYPPG